ncbi:MAG: 30S ribosomal protein S17 [Deltaproteobacteria bacterium]|nr:30S ribosomal protein S17 [Deltaproteobacteria bacterium]MBW1966249.1 30S ribosomal protein S17 [Deltaproteobacteria bacterium]MBW2097204.1 30S ribosomal protein S17 [Deltaproteobacteria bacterium]PXF53254.1 MAG: 30S ribosomal protein S17 [Deltaproteobacteria bacterium]RKX60890.1 MAG: 30S ribosomal protein S17 [Thermodesulfobacteriota bacterium]
MNAGRKSRRMLIGTVASNKMDKTVVVKVVRRVRHPVYGKYIQQQKKYMAHDAGNSCGIGDKILIEEYRPMSRRKRWLVREVIEKAL